MIGVMVLLMIVNVAVGGAYAYFHWRLDQIKRVDLPSLAEGNPEGVMNVLLVGSDSREGLTGEAALQAGKGVVTGQRTDTIMILHVDPNQQKAAVLSIPRDLFVPLAGTNRSDRINAAFGLGGAEPLVRTIRQSLGIQINHYVEVDFVGFQNLVDALGGVDFYLPTPVRDDFSGLEIMDTGCVTLDGSESLALVRSRQYESYENGSWQADARGDIGRIERQQQFIRRVMKKAVSQGISNPITLNRLVDIGVDFLTLDSRLSTNDLTELARRFSSFDPEKVEMSTLPTLPAEIDGASVLVLQEAEARQVVNRLNGVDTPPTAAPPASTASPAPSDVRIRVLNGNGVAQVAARAGSALEAAGFVVVERGDADSTNYNRTLLRFSGGQQAKAELVQRSLAAGADLQEDRGLQGADVALVLGKDFTQVQAAPGAASAAGPATPSTTTAAGSSSTAPAAVGC